MREWRRSLRPTGLLLTTLLWATGAPAATCENAADGEPQLLWGDLHVHTAYSLDAYAFGSIATPKEAYAFAQGQPLRMANGEMASIDRPLDFAAVTDHAASYDVMYLCTDPVYRDNAYCNAIRAGRDNRNARQIFNEYLLPLVSDVPPKPAPMCHGEGEGDADGEDCEAASASQWRRSQFAANDANQPCEFTALIGYEWTASPGGRHWHRNVIFRSERVPDRAVDYVHYPEVTSLWRELDAHCRVEDGCDAVTIPHNINWADGGPTFDVETASDAQLQTRARYERLAEIHQEKGNSECLPEHPDDEDPDCGFERLTENAAKAHLTGPEDISPEDAWKRMRSTYYRSLLGRGLAAYQRSGNTLNPMMLGAIGSTDNHFGTPGKVSEAGYGGSISSLWLNDEERLAAPGYNPGGLVAVWAASNTRADIFDALQSRSAYATSGPRIKLRFGASAENACERETVSYETPMGQTLAEPRSTPTFTVQVGRDAVPLAAVHIIKGEFWNGEIAEQTIAVAEFPEGRDAACVSWRDESFNAQAPAFWYARVLEQPSPRWTQLLCERAGLCDRFPDGNRTVAERAWSSPVWHLP
ncbi:MAG: DUF3604 domain-containing protein [Gammaproteobacteria bacterium]|nr:DUF3604 domain-containing protein [Gammaproteobacteria bacterium]